MLYAKFENDQVTEMYVMRFQGIEFKMSFGWYTIYCNNPGATDGYIMGQGVHGLIAIHALLMVSSLLQKEVADVTYTSTEMDSTVTPFYVDKTHQ